MAEITGYQPTRAGQNEQAYQIGQYRGAGAVLCAHISKGATMETCEGVTMREGVIVCPVCGGFNLAGRGVGKPSARLPTEDDTWVDGWDVVDFTCRDCGHKWRNGGNDETNER